ncbi:hypothetical protein GCM10010247_50970 [Streptomyces calvus]|nr:hypothetical protein GCM10010247_50970 [Streptomyces calvus]
MVVRPRAEGSPPPRRVPVLLREVVSKRSFSGAEARDEPPSVMSVITFRPFDRPLDYVMRGLPVSRQECGRLE